MRPSRMLFPSTHMRIVVLPAWNTTLPGFVAHSFCAFPRVLVCSPLLFLLNFWLVSQPSLQKLYPTPVSSVCFSESSFWLLRVCVPGLCGRAMVMALLSPQTICQNELGETGGMTQKKRGWVFVSNPACECGWVFLVLPVSLEDH